MIIVCYVRDIGEWSTPAQRSGNVSARPYCPGSRSGGAPTKKKGAINELRIFRKFPSRKTYIKENTYVRFRKFPSRVWTNLESVGGPLRS